jgi:hypothetical protein
VEATVDIIFHLRLKKYLNINAKISMGSISETPLADLQAIWKRFW